ncbi:SDR family NAD(P)-dependent oxidoreductase [Levilactobacillus suantsaii]|uniref:SDR family NAD(P)-dependent oxidoreductase n=1 Tax=Levilactobacillus suantsaii TaxID=2292255 RepID=UPI0015F70622|nr:SDR family NAD(P)-dependent oxidoreductase [Levilactobacillus suantsaii]QMU08450.1 SDR family NAD(P)-dependent oxidoreductase [Levilactobacillus suantsaii]
MTTTMILGGASGVGFEVARQFGAHDQGIIVVARDAAKVKAAVQALQQDGVTASGYACDVDDYLAVQDLFQKVTRKTPDLTTLIYNVGNKHLDNALSSDLATIQASFKTNVLSGIYAARLFLTQTATRGPRAILFTGGGASVRPSNKASTLSLTKAAQRSYVATLHEELAPKDVFVGLVTIQGIIDSSPEMQAAKVATAYWTLYQQRDQGEIFYPEHVGGSEFDRSNG